MTGLRARWKRWRWARAQRSLEAFAYGCAPAPFWDRVRRANDLAHVWERP